MNNRKYMSAQSIYSNGLKEVKKKMAHGYFINIQSLLKRASTSYKNGILNTGTPKYTYILSDYKPWSPLSL